MALVSLWLCHRFIGERSYPLAVDAFGGQRLVRDGLGQGADITSKLTGGRLAGLLQSHNQAIPALQSGLDGLARDFADQVNSVLDSGVDQFGTHPTTQLFRYEEAGPGISLTVNPLTAEQLALASAGDPGGNGKRDQTTQADNRAPSTQVRHAKNPHKYLPGDGRWELTKVDGSCDENK